MTDRRDRDIITQLSEVSVNPAEVQLRLEKVMLDHLIARKESHRWEKCPPRKFRIELDVKAGFFLHNRRWSGFKPKKMKDRAVSKYARLYKSWYDVQTAEELLDRPTRLDYRRGRGERLAAKFKRQR